MIKLYFFYSVFFLWLCAVAQAVGDYTAFYKALISMVCSLTLGLFVEIMGDDEI